jgi:hypothetical protein
VASACSAGRAPAGPGPDRSHSSAGPWRPPRAVAEPAAGPRPRSVPGSAPRGPGRREPVEDDRRHGRTAVCAPQPVDHTEERVHGGRRAVVGPGAQQLVGRREEALPPFVATAAGHAQTPCPVLHEQHRAPRLPGSKAFA